MELYLATKSNKYTIGDYKNYQKGFDLKQEKV